MEKMTLKIRLIGIAWSIGFGLSIGYFWYLGYKATCIGIIASIVYLSAWFFMEFINKSEEK